MGLTLDQAKKAIVASQAKAKEMGVNITTAVVDQGGHLVALERMDGPSWLTPDIAFGKAFTACAFKRPTEALAESAKANPTLFASITTFTDGRSVPAKGGFPITVKGEVIGGIGVSGATSEQDVECAQAGTSALG